MAARRSVGANDGIISTASLVLGVASAASSQNEALIAGVAGLVAGAMSMAAGEYVSVSSQSDTERADLARETLELANDRDFETEELARIMLSEASKLGLRAKSHGSLWPRTLSASTLATSLASQALAQPVRCKQPLRPLLLFQLAPPRLSCSSSSRPVTGCLRSSPLDSYCSWRSSARSAQEPVGRGSSRQRSGSLSGRARHGPDDGDRRDFRQSDLSAFRRSGPSVAARRRQSRARPICWRPCAVWT